MSIRTFQLNVDLKVLRKAFIEWKRRIAEKKEKNAKVEQWKRNSKRAVNAIWGGIQSERSVPIRSRSKASLKSLTRSEIAYNPTNDWDEIWTPAANLEAKDTEKKVSFELPTFTPQDASLRKVNAVSSSPSQRRVSTFSSSSTVQTPTAEKGVMTSPITPSGNRYDSLMPKPTVPFSEALPLSSRLSEKSSQDHHSNHSRQVISTPSRQVLTETNSAREATQNSEKPHFTDIIAPEECEISAEPNVQTEFVPESSASSFKAKSELTRRQIAERMSELMAPTQTAQVSKETNCFQATKELQDGQMEERTPNRRRTSASPQLISLNDYQTPNRPRSQSASPTAIKSTPKSFSKSKNASPRSLIIIPPDEKNMHQSPSSERTSLCETPKQAKNNIYFDLKENNKNTSIPRIPLSPLRDYITPFTSEDKVLPTTFKDEDDEYEQSSNDEDSLIEHAESEDESHSAFDIRK
ncbi:uncharacterized protein MONOS_10724 [Monocercomonoides exilis]|uniref:uncharacterized protein n=1 Tax=Monocercomonoides exilis TaxID=2049356 RepID=UPI00355994F1|nr:hypothetical protein MONOS_10724 [Monocercomonoides exilis]|eukprot:MONOS_10724.1-p1 / transcript=MONOS_10724.1 / gene=MONOS_10724 / organism=Monocercomonoides_exilis_PA203 / gene_product=unspecified product / transcript_product=unspecified product / location=Mono_scaffold00498:21420-22879(-) / protein_length=466 / sequence_SO=supercontig / SO=protein_coding / is_pseudo=false